MRYVCPGNERCGTIGVHARGAIAAARSCRQKPLTAAAVAVTYHHRVPFIAGARSVGLVSAVQSNKTGAQASWISWPRRRTR